MEILQELKTWMAVDSKASDTLRTKPTNKGYKLLLQGLSQEEKNSIIENIRKETNKEIYRVDLSKLVSKNIGETEKNLSKVFSEAQHKQRILFFDEADALFGKRTGVKDSHDKYANQEVSYLLQRIEEHPGISILAVNMKQNIDAAFTRRFTSIIHPSQTRK